MVVEQLAPWASLIAAILSIGYVVFNYRRMTADGAGGSTADGDPVPRPSVGDVANEHVGLLIVAVAMFGIAYVAHFALQGTAYFRPELIWGIPGLIVVLTALGLAVDPEEIDRGP